MSEAQTIDAEIDIDIDDKPIEEAKPKVEDEAMRGFMSKEDYVAKGGNPDDWRSPREFRERGELIKQNVSLRREFDNQIKNLNALHEVKLKNEREELLRLRDEAIEIADKTEFKRLDKQLDENQKQIEMVAPKVQQADIPPEVMEFLLEHPWSQDASDVRTIYANTVINKALDEGRTMATALRRAEQAVAAKFTDPKGKTTQIVESSRTAGAVKSESNNITWDQLTDKEEKLYLPEMWKSKTDFLKAVANDRKGTK